MTEGEGIAFLQWAAPRLGLRWAGFRRVRRQVFKRIDRRRAALALPDLAAYRAVLDADPAEWAVLDHLCRVTISRFGRDRAIWSALLPRLAAGANAWSAGCGAGEEPFTLSIAVQLAFQDAPLAVLGTDVDDGQLARAAAAVYPLAALRELPDDWRAAAFEPAGDGAARLRDRFRAPVRFERRDLRDEPPPGPFDMVLCRNLAFTYFEEALQRRTAQLLRASLRAGGVLVVGSHERVPDGVAGLVLADRSLYRAC